LFNKTEKKLKYKKKDIRKKLKYMYIIRMTYTNYYFYQTKYPVIYKYSYWGQFSSPHPVPDEILQNRNELKELYEIKSYKKLSTLSKVSFEKTQIIIDSEGNKGNRDAYKQCVYGYNEWYRDHTEYYKIDCFQRNILCVFITHTTDKEHETILHHGYIESKPIYALNQKTNLKIL